MTVFTQRRICAAFAGIAARASRSRILVVRRSLPGKPNSRWASETHNEDSRHRIEIARGHLGILVLHGRVSRHLGGMCWTSERLHVVELPSPSHSPVAVLFVVTVFVIAQL